MMKHLRRHTRFTAVVSRRRVAAGVVFVAAAAGGLVLLGHRPDYSLSPAASKLLSASPIAQADVSESPTDFSYGTARPKNGKASLTVATTPNAAASQQSYSAQLAKADGRLTFNTTGTSDSPTTPDNSMLSLQGAGADTSSELGFSMTPLFRASAGKRSGQHLLYPSADGQHIYTYMRNGIKEDIVLAEAPGKDAQYSWKLQLGSLLEARLLPSGAVGIYSADPNLYGDLQAADTKSQQLVDAARQKGAKTNLVFAIPAPYIKDAAGHQNSADVAYTLSGDVLTLSARNLDKQRYPLTIDPSVAVTSTADFQAGVDDGMIDYSMTGEIDRANISSGAVGTNTTQTSAFTTARYGHTSVVSNGYLYIIGGTNGTPQNDIQHCPITASTGVIGTCVQQTNAFTTARYNHTSVVSNGYLYIIGGTNGTNQNDIQYCPLNPSTGAVGTCVQQTSAFTTARNSFSSVTSNGYLYIIGGQGVGPTYLNDIQHCPLNADGSVGTCVQQTSAFTTARYDQTSVVSNGVLYIAAGVTSTGTYLDDIQHCPLNADGSVGTCVQQSAAITTARGGHSMVTSNGYLYIIGGITGSNQNDIQHCPLNADGSVGTCVQQTSAFTTARNSHTSVVANGYIYIIGGVASGVSQSDIQRVQITAATPSTFGNVSTFYTESNGLPAKRYRHASVAYNGYLYIIGGEHTSSDTSCNATASTYCSDVEVAPINTDGTVGTWVATTNLPFARGRFASVVSNNYLYVIGGIHGTADTACNTATATVCNDVIMAHINSDGTIGSWSATSPFTTARYKLQAEVYNGYLYILGGYHNANDTACDSAASTFECSDVQVAAISPTDGTLGAWTATSSFTTARYNFGAQAYNGHMYVIGGLQTPTNTACNTVASTQCNDVQVATINPSDGTVGTWTPTASFNTARYNHSTVAYNGYLYVIGGFHSTSDTACSVTADQNCSNIETAPINSDGTVGLWTAVANFAIGRNAQATAFYNGRMYISGGQQTGTDTDCSPVASTMCVDVQTASLLSPAQTSSYERLIDIGSQVTSIDSVNYGGSAVCGAELSYRTASSSGVFGALTANSFTYPATNYAVAASNQRYIWVRLQFDDSECGTNSKATDITVNYTNTNTGPPAPTISSPTSGAAAVSTTPQFQLRSTDANSDYLRYKIDVCSNSSCATIVRTVDQTASQTGWSGQDTQAGTAYVSAATLTSSTLAGYNYQAPALTAGTQYWWRAYAIDPGGSNTWSSASAIQSFTTTTSTSSVQINGGTVINGGTKLFN